MKKIFGRVASGLKHQPLTAPSLVRFRPRTFVACYSSAIFLLSAIFKGIKYQRKSGKNICFLQLLNNYAEENMLKNICVVFVTISPCLLFSLGPPVGLLEKKNTSDLTNVWGHCAKDGKDILLFTSHGFMEGSQDART